MELKGVTDVRRTRERGEEFHRLGGNVTSSSWLCHGAPGVTHYVDLLDVLQYNHTLCTCLHDLRLRTFDYQSAPSTSYLTHRK